MAGTALRPSNAPPCRRRGRSVALAVLLASLGAAACLENPPVGPLFAPAAAPQPGFARVYLYRVDPQHSYSAVEVQLDDRAPLRLMPDEYATLELEEGVHEIAYRLRRRIELPGWTRNAQRIDARAGETLYFAISVTVDAQPVSAGREAEVGGRTSGTAVEVATMRQVAASEGAAALRRTYLHRP